MKSNFFCGAAFPPLITLEVSLFLFDLCSMAEKYVYGSELWPLMARDGEEFHCVLRRFSDYLSTWEIGLQNNR